MKKVAIYCRVSTEEQDADKQEYICKRYCEANEEFEVYKIYKDVLANRELLQLNHDLIQLREVNISRNTKMILANQVKQPINRLLKHKFLQLVLEDKMNAGLKNPDYWLKENFTHIDAFASETQDLKGN